MRHIASVYFFMRKRREGERERKRKRDGRKEGRSLLHKLRV